MKNRVVVIALVLAVVVSVFGCSHLPIYSQIKADLVRGIPDGDGDYMSMSEDGEYLYSLGYIRHRQIGASKVHKESGYQVIIIYDELEKYYFAILAKNGKVVSQRIVSEEEAMKFAEEVKEKIDLIKRKK